MTDEQFEKFMAVQTAQLAMLQGIYRNAQAMVIGNNKTATHNWKDLEQDLKNALALVKNLK